MRLSHKVKHLLTLQLSNTLILKIIQMLLNAKSSQNIYGNILKSLNLNQ